MRLLLDTNVFIFWTTDRGLLAPDGADEGEQG